MRGRMSWTIARQIMKSNGISVGQGWTNTIDKLKPIEDIVDTGVLQDALIEHYLCGEKLTKLYQIDDQFGARLSSFVKNFEIADTPAAQAFPLGLSRSQIEQEDGRMKAISVQSNADGVGLLFSSVYKFQKTEEIPFNHFEDPADMKSRFNEIVGTRFERQELFHVVWIPHDGDFIEIRVDYPRGLKGAEVHGFHSQLKKIVNEWEIVSLNESVDLFPAVRRFYNDETDGHMFDITFATSTGAIKHEKALSRTGTRDQRKEAYHLAGKGAVAEIAIYKISIEWPRDGGEVTFLPTLTLAASAPSKGEASTDPRINAVHIQKCARVGDYEWAIGRLKEQCQI